MYRNKEDNLRNYDHAKAVYKDFDVDVDKAIESLKQSPFHCTAGRAMM